MRANTIPDSPVERVEPSASRPLLGSWFASFHAIPIGTHLINRLHFHHSKQSSGRGKGRARSFKGDQSAWTPCSEHECADVPEVNRADLFWRHSEVGPSIWRGVLTSENGATRLVRLLNIGIRSTAVCKSLCVVVVDSGSACFILLVFFADVGQY